MTKKIDKNKSFTLARLSITIVIIVIIAAIIFITLDPLTRFRNARDSSRWSDVSSIASAILIDQVDNGGSYIPIINYMTVGVPYMIGTDTTDCDDAYDAGNCDAAIIADTDCLDLTGLVNEGYLREVPVSPNGNGSWTPGKTGYTIMISSAGNITIQACESENTDQIIIVR